MRSTSAAAATNRTLEVRSSARTTTEERANSTRPRNDCANPALPKRRSFDGRIIILRTGPFSSGNADTAATHRHFSVMVVFTCATAAMIEIRNAFFATLDLERWMVYRVAERAVHFPSLLGANNTPMARLSIANKCINASLARHQRHRPLLTPLFKSFLDRATSLLILAEKKAKEDGWICVAMCRGKSKEWKFRSMKQPDATL